MPTASADLVVRVEGGASLSTLVWRFGASMRCVSTAAVGGGLTECAWVVNAQVPDGYRRTDLGVHGREIAAAMRLIGPGVVMLTAVDVRRHHVAEVDGVVVTATVGVRDPVWAAERNVATATVEPVIGTVNVVVQLPVPIAPAGLVNLIATVTEAKCQAFAAAGVPGTGTPSDAVTVVCPAGADSDPFGGPRSVWGSRAACAAYDAIAAGLR